MTQDEEFYIGWEGKAAPGLARFARGRVLAMLVLAAAVAGGVAATQAPFGTSRFEFGIERTFEGRVEASPYPILVVDRPGSTAAANSKSTSSWLLTVFGKQGANGAVAEFIGHRVRVNGSLIDRDGVTMVEILPDTFEDLGVDPVYVAGSMAGSLAGPVTTTTLRGEIVDSKCYLGVMKPGNLKVHRACATRCISGGVPPVLLVRRPDGTARYVLLVDAEGAAVNDRILDLIAEPVEITGSLSTMGDLEVLRADPAGYQRLDG